MATDATTKTCPDCAEEIKAAARVCRFCGYRFDCPSGAPDEPTPPVREPMPEPVSAQPQTTAGATVQEPAQEGPDRVITPSVPEAKDAPDPKPRRSLGDTLRWPIALVGILLATLAFAQPDALCGSFRDSSELVGSVIGGIVGTLIWWLIIAAVVWGVARLLKRRRSFGSVVESYPVMLSAIGLVILASAGQAANRARECDESRSGLTNAAPALAGLTEEERDYALFRKDFNPVAQGYQDAISDGNRLYLSIKDQGDFPAAERKSEKLLEDWRELAADARLIHATSPELIAIRGRLISGFDLFVAAYEDYVAGFEPLDQERLDTGDLTFDRAQRRVTRAIVDLQAIHDDLGL